MEEMVIEKKRGRPRKDDNQNNNGEVTANAPVEQLNEDGFLPYTGKESLEGEGYGPILDKKGRVKRIGKRKYFINRNGNTFKLIAVYRGGKGISRRLSKVLKPYKRNNSEDREIMRQLFESGIQGAIKI